MKTIGVRIASLLPVLFLLTSPLMGQLEEHVLSGGRSYTIDETGTISQLGVHISVKPLIGHAGISGFQVGLTYKDPFYNDSPETSFLNPKFFHTSCSISQESRELGTYIHTNERKTRFQIRLFQGCKATPAGLPVPFLEVDIRCSDVGKELRYLYVRQDGRVFDIFPTGEWEKVQTDTGKALGVAKDAYDVYDTVSTILIVFDLVAISHGTLAAEEFVLEQVAGAVVGVAVDHMFDYLQSQYGMRVEFKHTGWTVVCRLCGRRFHRNSLSDGEVLKCTNTQCKAKAVLRFH